jgi:hypothetical protein
MRNAKFRLIGTLGCVVVSIAACTGGTGGGHSSPEPSSTPPLASSTPSPTVSSTDPPTAVVPTTGPNVSPGEKPPVLGALGKTNTPQGATLFARYWFAALDWGYATTSSALARELYLPSCSDCERFMKNFDEPRARQQHFRGGRSVVLGTLLVDDDNRHLGSTVVDVTIRVAALTTLDSFGNEVESAPAIGSLIYRLWLRWRTGKWAVIDFKQVVDR